MEKEKIMQKEISEKRKLPIEKENKTRLEILSNFLLAIFIMIYMLLINLEYTSEDTLKFRQYTKIIIIMLTLVMITFFEIGYRKEKVKYVITAIELFVCDLILIYIPYVYTKCGEITIRIFMILPIFLGVYYSIKNLIIYRKQQIKHKNTLSDVKQIVK